MASSFVDQIPVIIYAMQRIAPTSILDVGKGLGKYGMLAHEYLGIDHKIRPQPNVKVRNQSSLVVDGIEINSNYDFPHIDSFYRSVIWEDVRSLKEKLPRYDLILMVDVIEHLDKEEGLNLLNYFLRKESTCLISSPTKFFQQELFESDWENHRSHWKPSDFRKVGWLDYQKTNSSTVYLLSSKPNPIKGFGNSPLQKLKRLARAFLNET